MAISTDQAQPLSGGGGNVLTSPGDKIGGIGQIYLDNNTSEPSWVTVKTGLFGTKESFVPLSDARVDGDDVVVGYDEAKVKDAPRVDPDGALSEQEEDQLYDYYGLGGGTGYATTGTATSGTTTTDTTYETAGVGTAGYETRDRDVDTRSDRSDTRRATVGHDTSGPTTDDAMTRSEEQLRVGTRREETGLYFFIY